jgi:hypothetical protein
MIKITTEVINSGSIMIREVDGYDGYDMVIGWDEWFDDDMDGDHCLAHP